MINLSEMSESHILKQKDIRELAGWSRSTFIRRMKVGMTPRLLIENGKCKGCTVKAYKEWINSLQQKQ